MGIALDATRQDAGSGTNFVAFALEIWLVEEYVVTSTIRWS